MDKLIEKVTDVMELQRRIHCAVELVRVVHTTITEGANVPGENDFDALFGAYWLLKVLEEEMEDTGKKLLASVRNENNEKAFVR